MTFTIILAMSVCILIAKTFFVNEPPDNSLKKSERSLDYREQKFDCENDESETVYEIF